MAGKRRVARASAAGAVFVLGLSVGLTGCALLIPPSWRGSAPVPLSGPVPPAAAATTAGSISAEELKSLSDEQLAARIEKDRTRLVELASQGSDGQPSDGAEERQEESPGESAELQQEMREIAQRLPLLQREIADRGAETSGTRIRHPVIR